MGKRGGFLFVVKRVLSCESKANKEKKSHKSGTWFGEQGSVNSVSAGVEDGVTVPAANSSMEEVKLMEAENEQNRHAYSVAIATAVAAEAAVAAAHAAAEVVRLTAAAQNSGKSKEEVAAIKIQTTFRGYMARRALRALRGLVRLTSFIGGQSVKRQAATTLKCMQTLARVQSEIRMSRIKMSEDNLAIQRQIQQKRDKELDKLRESSGENWDDSMLSKEQVEANIQNQKDAAMKRERSLAYAYSHQQTWKDSSTSSNQTFMDPNSPHWGWSWLERWMAARPWDNTRSIGKEVNSNHASVKSSTSRSLSTRGNSKIHSPTTQKQSRPPSRQSPTPSSKITSRVRPSSSRGTIGADEDLNSMNSVHSDRCRRHSIAGSSVRDFVSLASSPAAPGYMTPTESARAKARLPRPLGVRGMPDKMSGGSAKKRLSFSGSPAETRRHSGPPKIDTSHTKDPQTRNLVKSCGDVIK